MALFCVVVLAAELGRCQLGGYFFDSGRIAAALVGGVCGYLLFLLLSHFKQERAEQHRTIAALFLVAETVGLIVYALHQFGIGL